MSKQKDSIALVFRILSHLQFNNHSPEKASVQGLNVMLQYKISRSIYQPKLCLTPSQPRMSTYVEKTQPSSPHTSQSRLVIIIYLNNFRPIIGEFSPTGYKVKQGNMAPKKKNEYCNPPHYANLEYNPRCRYTACPLLDPPPAKRKRCLYRIRTR